MSKIWFSVIWKRGALKKVTGEKHGNYNRNLSHPCELPETWTGVLPSFYPFKERPVNWEWMRKGKELKIPRLSTTYVYGLINCNDVPRTLRQKHVSEEKKLKWLCKYMKSLLEWSTYNHFWNMWLRNIDAIFLGTNQDI